jgi:hypothetical protein
MSDDWTPTTEGVRLMYSKGFEGAWQPFEGLITTPEQARKDFDCWLAKHDLEAFDAGFAHGAEYGHVSQGMWPTH